MCPTALLEQEATQSLVASSQQEYPSYEIVVLGGTRDGQSVAVGPSGITVGTSPSCQLELDDPTVSRMHCEIKLVDNRPHVVDLKSTNGVIVNGVPVREAALPPHCTIHLGNSTLRVETGQQVFAVELSTRNSFGAVLGISREMRRLFTVLERAARTEATVLLQGETGVGKEVVARAIHEASSRSEGPFVVVDCGAIAESVIESELFGHARGAFSGAISERKGLFEEANGGTLFLDEIGELPMTLQPKLLRVLESRQVRRVGRNTSCPVDVRIVAATNVSLAEGINEGTFREDLYYRIAVVEAHLPPLRQRREDIVPLAEHFYRRYSGSEDGLPVGLADTLRLRAWPGNVRELRNFIERSVSLGFAESARHQPPRDLPIDALASVVPTHLPLKDARAQWTSQFELLYVRALLEKTGWNLSKAAEHAGVHVRSMQRLVAQFDLRQGRKGGAPDE